MKHRKLRIAWSVAWGILAVLLVALWLRSYWWEDVFVFQMSPYAAPGGISYSGRLMLGEEESNEEIPLHSSLRIQDHPWLPEEMNKHRAPWRIGLFKLQRGVYLEIPHFIAIILVSVVAGGIWWEWRFSLRAFLLVTTLAAVGLGLLAWAAIRI